MSRWARRLLTVALLAAGILAVTTPAQAQRRSRSGRSSYSRSYSPRSSRSSGYHAPRVRSYRAPAYRAPRARAYRAPAYRAPRVRTYQPRVSRARTPRAYTPRASRAPSYSAGGAARDSRGRIRRSAEARREFMRATGYPRGRPGYIIDHIKPLACGGEDAPSNMQWQTRAAAKAKDRTERIGCPSGRRK